MATKKITMNELRNLIKQVIKEEVEQNNIIPIYKLEKYNDNDGAYDMIVYFDQGNKKIFKEKLIGSESSKYGDKINYDFFKANEGEIKKILINDIISEHGNFLGKVYYWGDGKYNNIPVSVKGSKKYKDNTAELLEIKEVYNNYSHSKVMAAKILGNDGETYLISPNTLTVSDDIIKDMLSKKSAVDLLGFDKYSRNDKYYLNN